MIPNHFCNNYMKVVPKLTFKVWHLEIQSAKRQVLWQTQHDPSNIIYRWPARMV